MARRSPGPLPATGALTPPRRPGRPRRPDLDDAILTATLSLLAERGYQETTMSAVVRRSGVSRASVYLRWPNRELLVAAAFRRAMGREPLRVTGDLEADLRRGADQARFNFDQPGFRSVLGALVDAMLRARPSASNLTAASVMPGYFDLVAEYGERARQARFRDDIQPEIPAELIVGGLLLHLLTTGEPPSQAYADQLVDAVVGGLRAGGG